MKPYLLFSEKTNISEIKNLNSFSAAVRASEFEEKRHIELLKKGEDTEKETRRWDDVENQTLSMRTKGEASDYRFAADGDISDIDVDREWIEEIRRNMPELPDAKKERFMETYKLSSYDAEVLTAARDIADFYEETVKYNGEANLVSNWMMGDVLRRLNQDDLAIEDTHLTAKYLADLINLVKDKKINNNTGKKVLRDMFETGKTPGVIVKEKGLIQISDKVELEEIVMETLDNNPQSIEDFKNGKDRAIGFLVGQIMKATKGKANPQLVNKLLMEKIKER